MGQVPDRQRGRRDAGRVWRVPGLARRELAGDARFCFVRRDITRPSEAGGEDHNAIDAALGDLVHSAFGHAGQKCSAASLAIVEASVYDDPSFHRRLAAAVESLVVGWPSAPAERLRRSR